MLSSAEGGKIVNIYSVAGKMGGLYGASMPPPRPCHRTDMALSTEFAKRKIWVNAITADRYGPK